jgi:N-acetyl-gamma-glutamyl-phosphate reductase
MPAGADYRFHDLDTYQQWYGVEHPDPGRLKTAVYGLPEIYRQGIPDAELVANPGCYPTAAILALAPLLKAGVIEPAGIIIDSKSGVSGAGKQPKAHLHFPECNESVMAYGVGTHRHMPEIDQTLTHVTTDWEAGESATVVNVLFTPHLMPMDRGILSTNYAVPVGDVSEASLLEVLRAAYGDEPFVRVVDNPPTTKQVSGTNFCDITARSVRGRVIVISAIDNLIKGAAGAAVQNFNLMYGFAETTALL